MPCFELTNNIYNISRQRHKMKIKIKRKSRIKSSIKEVNIKIFSN